MSEYEYYHEPTLPYETTYLSEWCRIHGVDESQFQYWHFGDLSIAKLRSREVSLEMQLRQEIETSLPLEGSARVEDIGLKPEFWGTQPKIFLAPKGMAFELKVMVNYDEFDEDENGFRLPPTHSETLSFVGEYLNIGIETTGGKQQGHITVRERPDYFAVPTINDGNPEKDGMIRLPSRADPDKEGAYVAFARLNGWEIVHSLTRGLTGEYGKSSVRLVPSEKKEETELYVADFAEFNDFKLDDFIFVDETPTLPPGYVMMPKRTQDGGLEWYPMHSPVSQLILPPIDEDAWTSLWEKHGVMVKHNPGAFRFNSRFYHLHFDHRLDKLAFGIRQFNTYAHNDKAFMKALAIRDIGNATLNEILKVALSKDQFEGEYREKFG